MRKLQNISLTDIMAGLSPSMVNDPDIQAMCATIDAALHKTVASIPNVAIMHNLRHDNIPDDDNGSLLIDSLAWQFHVDFYDSTMPFAVRRNLTANSLPWHMKKGTPSVVEEIVTAVFADGVVTEWFEYGGLPYRFNISTEVTNFTDEVMHNLISAIFTVKNTRSWIDYIEVVNRSNVQWYAAFGLISESTIYVSISDPIDTDDRPIIAPVYAGIKPELDGYATVKAPDAVRATASATIYAGIKPEFDGYVTVGAGGLPA